MDRRTALGTLAAVPLIAACRSEPPRVVVHGDVVRSVEPLSGMHWKTRDPFLFCAHHDDGYPKANDALGPAASLAGHHIGDDFASVGGFNMYHGDVVPGFPQHPHRGFETVTIVRRGLVDHSDSLGAAARYGRGDVQWLTAGNGIVHAEMFPLLEKDAPNPLELFQVWLNLPAADKLVAPHFSMLWNESIPRSTVVDTNGKSTEVAIIAGRLGAVSAPPPPPKSWAARADSDIAIWTLKMAPGARFTLPAARVGTNRTLYFFRGSRLKVFERAIVGASMIELLDGEASLENGPDESELLLLQGRPIGEPVVQRGPFVMNTAAEIPKAFNDYRATQFGGWPWPSDAPVNGHDGTRFARHADGRYERA